jgi:hypothetical protein
MATSATPQQRATSAARIAAEFATKPLTLRVFGAVQAQVASVMNVTPATARKYLQAAVEAGLLVEVKPRSDWTIMHAIPGSTQWPTLDLTVYADGSGGSYWVSASKPYGRPPAQSLSFLITPEQQAELGRIYKAEAEAIAAKQKAEEDADRTEALRRDPEMVALLDKLAELLPHSDVKALPVNRSEAVVPSVHISRRDAEAFKAVLRAAFDKEN